jgi:hypothetical protein
MKNDLPSSVVVLEDWESPQWRINNIYTIVNDQGELVPFRMNPEQEELFSNLWYWNLILKARQMGFCLDPSTRVLTADLRWVPIGELHAGDEVVAVDEQPPGGRGSGRKMRTATVQAVVEVHRKAYRITFDDGRSVVCTAKHPWLSKKVSTEAEWRSIDGTGNAVTGRLKVGTRVRWITKPWDASSVEDGWFGGLLDGEGSISKANSSAGLNVSQRQGAVWDRAVRYAAERGYNACIESDKAERPSKHGKVPVPQLSFGRMDEIFRLIGQTRPTRFVGNRFWEGRELPGKRNGGIGWSTIVSIEPMDEQVMIDLQTSTGTYIAEGFVSHNTTAIDIFGLDQCLFNKSFRFGIIAQTEPDVLKLFKNKIKKPYDLLPAGLRQKVGLKADNATSLEFGNGSSIQVGMSMRSDTLQMLHVSEFGKICAKAPERAREIVTGAFETLAVGNVAFIESTAEGESGYFHDYCMGALKKQQSGEKLSKLDMRLHFFPWWKKPTNRLDPEGIVIDANFEKYFTQLQLKHGIYLDAEQRAWYVKKAETLKADMTREHPSFPEEAFEHQIEGAIFGDEMTWLRLNGRITDVPWDSSYPVDVFFDLGVSDTTAIWFRQKVGMANRFIDYMEESGKGIGHFCKEMKERPYTYGRIYLPHDGKSNLQGEIVETREEIFNRLGFNNTEIVPRVAKKNIGIDLTRNKFSTVWMDRTKCALGIKSLDNYVRQWNDRLGKFSDEPLHNWASNGADAFMQWGQTPDNGQGTSNKSTQKKSVAPRNWRVL